MTDQQAARRIAELEDCLAGMRAAYEKLAEANALLVRAYERLEHAFGVLDRSHKQLQEALDLNIQSLGEAAGDNPAALSVGLH